MKRWIWGLILIAGLAAALRLMVRFPWPETGAALTAMHPLLLVAALAVNLLSPLAKGQAWHLLLRPVAPHRWRSAQEATLVGSAVNSISMGVTGDAARVTLMARREIVPVSTAVLSVAWTRVVEAMGLALFLVLAPSFMHVPAAVRGLQIGAATAVVSVFALSRFGRWARLIVRLPRVLRQPATLLARMSVGTRLAGPVVCALVNWLAQWATYDLVLRAAGLGLPVSASLTALLAVNIGGVGRLTPGNLGVTQAAMVGALLPYHVAAERAVAAGLALQAIQVLPVLCLAAALVGWTGLRRLGKAAPDEKAELEAAA
jgi:glycosyltransferase 2 family protein